MSHKCDTFQALNQPLVLPELPWNNNDRYSSCIEYQFVHLGPQQVCLVLHKFFYPSEDIPDYLSLPESEKLAFPGRNKRNVFLITFEYEISNSESLDIHYRLLTTRHLEYISKRANRRFATCTKTARLSGATVL
ncbi:hypothetical protein M0R45_007321 [Rubus argutus]|uniref:Uncharacterized protein n=1 Tax=Rubus argutus TaxID=59490 RepID=A0AAW1XY79_RUBAR